MVVLPVPGAPSTRNKCPRESPPDRISSKPQIPVFAHPQTFRQQSLTPPYPVRNICGINGFPGKIARTGNYFGGRNSGYIARHFPASERKSDGAFVALRAGCRLYPRLRALHEHMGDRHQPVGVIERARAPIDSSIRPLREPVVRAAQSPQNHTQIRARGRTRAILWLARHDVKALRRHRHVQRERAAGRSLTFVQCSVEQQRKRCDLVADRAAANSRRSGEARVVVALLSSPRSPEVPNLPATFQAFPVCRCSALLDHQALHGAAEITPLDPPAAPSQGLRRPGRSRIPRPARSIRRPAHAQSSR